MTMPSDAKQNNTITAHRPPCAATIRNYDLRIRRVRLADAGAPYGQRVTAPDDVKAIAQQLIGANAHETFVVLYVDVKHRVQGFTEVAKGSVDMCPVDPRAVFRTAVVLGSTAIVAAHAHPSGDPSPSTEDIELTRRLRAGGDLLEIQLLDHVIVTDEACVSLRELNLL